jgi:hypothetical protein
MIFGGKTLEPSHWQPVSGCAAPCQGTYAYPTAQ